MAQVKNQYKVELKRAMDSVENIRDGLTEGGSLTAVIADTVPNGGWYCAEADTWFEDVVHQCGQVATAFDSAVETVNVAWEAEDEFVDEGDWRGSYLAGGASSGAAAGMIPV